MSDTIIKLEPVLSPVEANILKQYRLGQVGTWRLSLAEAQTLRGKEDPTLKIGQTNQINLQPAILNGL
ncbi:MAG: hypothetical protein U0W24_13400 [Bacteroidales bacterium]